MTSACAVEQRVTGMELLLFRTSCEKFKHIDKIVNYLRNVSTCIKEQEPDIKLTPDKVKIVNDLPEKRRFPQRFGTIWPRPREKRHSTSI